MANAVRYFSALLCMLLSVGAIAEEQSSTIRKIKATETITVGFRESSIPFSYYDQQQNVIGYSYELMLRIIDFIKEETGLPKLTIKLFPITPLNRIPLVQSGTIDIECGSTTNNAERAKLVAFSNTIFVATTRLLTKKNSGIRDFPDLAGKTVATS